MVSHHFLFFVLSSTVSPLDSYRGWDKGWVGSTRQSSILKVTSVRVLEGHNVLTAGSGSCASIDPNSIQRGAETRNQ